MCLLSQQLATHLTSQLTNTKQTKRRVNTYHPPQEIEHKSTHKGITRRGNGNGEMEGEGEGMPTQKSHVITQQERK